MEKRKSFYVSPKNGLTWLVALCMICSAVARVLFVGVKGTDMWSQIVLPIAAVLLYGVICLLSGKEHFYKTAIPFWMICIYYGFHFWGYDFGNFDILIGSLFAAVLLFIAIMYTQVTCGKVPATSVILLLALAPFGAKIRDNTPEGYAGRLQGVRIFSQVLVPGVIGPFIGKTILANADVIVNSDGTTSFVPNANIFLGALIALIPVIIIVLGSKNKKA